MQREARFFGGLLSFLYLCTSKNADIKKTMKIRFMSLGSGSSGNCYYLATDTYSILIDAGVGIRSIKKTFKDYNLNIQELKAILITHDHADHIKAVGNLAKKYNIPVYTTQEIHKGMQRSYCMTEKLSAEHTCLLYKETPIQLGDFNVTCFEVPHDGTDNVGYFIEADNKTFAFLTDMGHITPTAATYISRANYLILEANYDDEMLQMGPYPPHLKVRIAGANGHMSNRDTAQFLAEHFPPDLKYLWLCHLSKDNNHPELAYKTVELALKKRDIIAGRDVQVIPLKRTLPSELYCFE